MWTRLLIVLIIVLAIFAGAYYVQKEPSEAGRQATTGPRVLKEAKNVVMYERKTDSGKSLVIRARTVTQLSESEFLMDEFLVDRSDGTKIEGRRARYDTDKNVIEVTGPMTVDTADGWKARVTDLVWDRKEEHAVTSKPVLVEGADGTIRADRAEFFDDFDRIHLSGNVHARVAQNIIAD
ncbi:MAG TPA: hypothetical protein PKM41_06455 [Deltaproteobacteria bacterium]|jgi:hypothetical protein|nr:hypothetical protein [Deltaproteobacteria bacterium]HOI06750.1 hypothetical protein [Deltaproteobacteria bacterium]